MRSVKESEKVLFFFYFYSLPIVCVFTVAEPKIKKKIGTQDENG